MTENRLVALADRFWTAAGGLPPPPRDLQTSIARVLPVTTVSLQGLTISRVERWLSVRGIPHRINAVDRRLHGCLIAARGHGVIFLDGADLEDEQRFTLAHETAHFLLDYQEPRARSVQQLGMTIVQVLDGDRLPTLDERIAAALGGSELEIETHLLERLGDLGARAAGLEARVDRLAWELLAPANELLQHVASQRPDQIRTALILRYGLPPNAAEHYTRSLRRDYGPPPSFVEWLQS